MVLSDKDIKQAILTKRIIIKPRPDFQTQLGSCSIDLRLGNTFRVFEQSRYPYIDPSTKDYSNEITNNHISASFALSSRFRLHLPGRYKALYKGFV